jgi:DNA sulfur modification protein DndC
MANKKTIPPSVFDELGFVESIKALTTEIKDFYLSDDIPWVVGYSGGKDSTTVVQLVWNALSKISPEQRKKHVYVISTDTLIENPIVAQWVNKSLLKMNKAANEQGLPITSHPLKPKLSNTFWVNLIGKGYPAPRPLFRWCTERLKIMPSSDFISEVVKVSGEAIVALGVRKNESQIRKRVMEKHGGKSFKNNLTRNSNLPNSFIYTPVEDWSNDDVWMYLMHIPNPWGHNNQELLALYKGATDGGECPLVVDTSMPSCGDSRFGCWMCTMVSKDKSMDAMIQNDADKEWLLPLLEFRNGFDVKDDRHLRDFRRMTGQVQIYKGRPIPGPYLQEARERMLRELLEIQERVKGKAPSELGEFKVITLDEIQEIRRIWVLEKRELEDSVPQIYKESTGNDYPLESIDDNLVFGQREMALLKEICEGDALQYELSRDLLDIERSYRNMSRRAGLFDALEKAFKKSFYADEEDAVERAKRKSEVITAVKEKYQ